MITARELAHMASEIGFRSDIVEKVLHLTGILDRLGRHEVTQGNWLLKGGTALNLLHLDVPRLSVDIDLNFVGSQDVDAMCSDRPDFERALTACCEREGCTVRRSPSEHAGGKFRLRYPSVLGGTQNLEVDVSYVARVPLWGSLRVPVRFPPGSSLQVPTLTIEELAAGKFAALVQRAAARDAFDAASLLDLHQDLLERPSFRIAFVCSAATSRTDARELRLRQPILGARAFERDLEPLLRARPETRGRDPREVHGWIEDRVTPAVERVLSWSAMERRFLDRLLDAGEIEAELLHDDQEVQARIRMQPMLQWKAQHVRDYRRRP